MIRSYKYLECVQEKLNEFVLAFFDKIEFENGVFDDIFFEPDFKDIAISHRKIIRGRCKEIYDVIKNKSQADKTALCDEIRNSNNIQNICSGNYTPKIFGKNETGIYKLLKEFFIDLYEQVLDGDAFNEKFNTSLKEHSQKFSEFNSNLTLCPLCGIGELKKQFDTIRDQYDHYLPISLYPFSAVNLRNLVPTCEGCNSTTVKGNKDVVTISRGKLFFLYQENYNGITLTCNIISDHVDIDNIEWEITYVNPDGYADEIESWKSIYCIEKRYRGYIKGRIGKWYKHYWEYMRDSDLNNLSQEEKNKSYNVYLKYDKSLGLTFIRKPALEGFLSGSVLPLAAIQARDYSI